MFGLSVQVVSIIFVDIHGEKNVHGLKYFKMDLIEEKIKLKKEIIEREMSKFWDYCKYTTGNHHIRESWVKSEVVYNSSGNAVPKSIQEFSEIFLKGLSNIIEKI